MQGGDGFYSLGDIAITTAGTYLGEWVTDLDGMTALTSKISLAYGSGGTKIQAYLQTSLDQGSTAVDIACVTFATAGATKLQNFSGLTPKLTEVTPTDGALADDTALDGILGDRLRLKIVSTGTYGGSTVVSGRVAVR